MKETVEDALLVTNALYCLISLQKIELAMTRMLRVCPDGALRNEALFYRAASGEERTARREGEC